MPRCDYCHAEEGESHACNCLAPNGTHAGEIVVPRSDIAMLIEDNEDLRTEVDQLKRQKEYDDEQMDRYEARITELEEHIDDIETASELPYLRERISELEGALEKIAAEDSKPSGSARNGHFAKVARAALSQEKQ